MKACKQTLSKDGNYINIGKPLKKQNKSLVKDIQKTYTLLNKQDKSIFPNLARTYIRNAADKAFIIKPEGVSLKSGFDIYKALAGTPQQKANFNQVLKGVADANGVNPNKLLDSFNDFILLSITYSI